MVPPTPSQSYFIAARNLVNGADALSDGANNTGVACAFLAAQALECILKSYLSHVGVSEGDLKNNTLRHNLEALWAMAVEHGFSVQSNPPRWCDVLNSGHDKPYYFRYPIGLNSVALPVLATMVSDLNDLLEEVGKVVK